MYFSVVVILVLWITFCLFLKFKSTSKYDKKIVYRYMLLCSSFSILFGVGILILNIDQDNVYHTKIYTEVLPTSILVGCIIYIMIMLLLTIIIQKLCNRAWVKGIVYPFGGWMTGSFIFDLFLSIEMRLQEYERLSYIGVFVSIGIFYALLDIYTDKKMRIASTKQTFNHPTA